MPSRCLYPRKAVEWENLTVDVATNQETPASINWEQTDLYRFFARLFARPSRECFEFLAQPAIAGHLRELGQYLGCHEKVPEFKHRKRPQLVGSVTCGKRSNKIPPAPASAPSQSAGPLFGPR